MIPHAFKPFVYTARFAKGVIPLVDHEMVRWERAARAIPSPGLQYQALASIRSKRFHAEGGAVFAAADPTVGRRIIPPIVALQTISDYLDNLGDRTESMDERDFRSLHQAMLDAVRLEPADHDYYQYHPEKDDGGYLKSLVTQCRQALAALPDYHLVQHEVQRQIERYCDLQVFKHLPRDQREERLMSWHLAHPDCPDGLPWWEFGAACGSTLGVFALFLEAAVGTTEGRMRKIADVYFPSICGIHILLDYLIDQEEDRLAGDLNFVSYYPEPAEALHGMRTLVRQAVRAVRGLPDAPFHMAVVEGLLGLYLTDAKVKSQGMRPFAYRLLRAAHPRAWIVYWYCLGWRKRYGRLDG